MSARTARPGGVLLDLVDLVMPSVCAGCATAGAGQACPACRAGLAALRPRVTVPTPAPPGLPRCVALGEYGGQMRGLILSYKERGAHRLAGPLGAALARVVAVAGGPGPLLLVPVPGTAAANRARHGDHVLRLARHAAGALRRTGHPALVAECLAARPKADSSHLAAVDRLALAGDAFRVRPARLGRVRDAAAAGASVVIVDDIITTGATLAAVTALLARSGVPIGGAATLAATRRRDPRHHAA